MIKIAVTGSIASGKSTVSKIISRNKYPIFSADKVVSRFYRDKRFLIKLSKLFKIKSKFNIKKKIKEEITSNQKKLRSLEKLIHPFVRKKMKEFINKNKKKKLLIFEIPLLVESKLTKHFEISIFVNAKKAIREKRYFKKNKSKKLFNYLNKRQLSPKKKIKACNYVINNNGSIKLLKKKISYIIENYV